MNPIYHSGQNKSGVKGKDICKVCGESFSPKQDVPWWDRKKKSEIRATHECHFVENFSGHFVRESLIQTALKELKGE